MNQYGLFFALIGKLGWEEPRWRDFVAENTAGRCRSIKACNEAECAEIIANLQLLCADKKPKQNLRLIGYIYALAYELNFTKAGAKNQTVIDNERLDNFLIDRSAAHKCLDTQNDAELKSSIISLRAYLQFIIKHPQ